MNVENITALRDFLRDEVKNAWFNMKYIFRDMKRRRDSAITDLSPAESLKSCGTAACICGRAAFKFDPLSRNQTYDVGLRSLGLGWITGNRLFCPLGHDTHPGQFTRLAAVEVLTILLETGEVNWPLAKKRAKLNEKAKP